MHTLTEWGFEISNSVEFSEAAPTSACIVKINYINNYICVLDYKWFKPAMNGVGPCQANK